MFPYLLLYIFFDLELYMFVLPLRPKEGPPPTRLMKLVSYGDFIDDIIFSYGVNLDPDFDYSFFF